MQCIWSCDRKNFIKAESTGLRATFFYPGGGTYKGYWQQSKHHQYGVKERKDQLIYNGQWKNGKRHGWGSMDKRLPDGRLERIYVGQFADNVRCGEGKGFYKDGSYYGWWKDNKRHGLGIMWYKDGTQYLGEWEVDVHHGMGVMFYTNGNRYEGHFARGYKNGEGTFFHNHTGQIQKGMWLNDFCKQSVVQDEFRNQVDQPTQYPIPSCRLAFPNRFIHDLFQLHMPNSKKPAKSLKEENMLIFINYLKRYCILEPKATSDLQLPRFEMDFQCTCKMPEVALSKI